MAFYSDAQANQLVQAIRAELPGMIAVAVVDIDTGMSLASFSNNATFDADTAAAYHAEVIKQQRSAMTAMKLDDDRVEDVFVSLEDQLHLIRLSPGGLSFLYLAVSPRETNLAIAREVVRRYAQQLR